MSVVRTEVIDNIFYISLNKPNKKNAFDPEMIELLTQAFLSVGQLKNVAGVYLSGAGDCFCAGADLGWMKSMVNYSLEENIQDSEKLFDMFLAGLHCPLPVVGYFHGYVMGGATGLAAICDIGISEENTKYCFSEVKLGLAPAVISPFVMAKMKANFAQEYMLTAKLFGSQEALGSGLVNYSESQQNCEQIIDKILNRLLKNGPEAVKETKKLLREVNPSQVASFKKITTKVIAERRVSQEGQEGLSAFFSKTKPNWLGV